MSATGAAGTIVPGKERQINAAELLGRFAPVFFLLAIVVVLSVLEPGFRTERNMWNVIRQVSFIGILAVGMTFVILTAGIDLSVGSMLAFTGIVCASAAKGARGLIAGGTEDKGGVHVLYAVLAAVGLGLLLGLIHGFLIGYLEIPAFIVTLGVLGIWRCATL